MHLYPGSLAAHQERSREGKGTKANFPLSRFSHQSLKSNEPLPFVHTTLVLTNVLKSSFASEFFKTLRCSGEANLGCELRKGTTTSLRGRWLQNVSTKHFKEFLVNGKAYSKEQTGAACGNKCWYQKLTPKHLFFSHECFYTRKQLFYLNNTS